WNLRRQVRRWRGGGLAGSPVSVRSLVSGNSFIPSSEQACARGIARSTQKLTYLAGRVETGRFLDFVFLWSAVFWHRFCFSLDCGAFPPHSEEKKQKQKRCQNTALQRVRGEKKMVLLR